MGDRATCRSFSLVPIGKGIFGGARRAMPTVQPEERPTVRPPLHLAAQLAAQLPEQLAAQLVEELVVRYSTADRNKPAARRAQPAVQLAAQLEAKLAAEPAEQPGVRYSTGTRTTGCTAGWPVGFTADVMNSKFKFPWSWRHSWMHTSIYAGS